MSGVWNTFYIRPFEFTISSNTVNANLRTLAVNSGWDEVRPLIATINTGIYVYSNDTAIPALTISGTFTNGVTLINNGFIIGMGGAGGDGQYKGAGSPGSPGGPSLSVSSSVSINNQGTIAGGGGGGGGNATASVSDTAGGGGGQTGLVNSAGGSANAPGAEGTVIGPGLGGVYSSTSSGGDGGVWGANGADGTSTNIYAGGAGGAGGAAVTGNTNVTWINTGTRLGAIT